LHPFFAVLHSLLPLQLLMPAHFTDPVSAATAKEKLTLEANNAAAAVAMAIPDFIKALLVKRVQKT
jgi:hypothetical protein